MWAFERFLVGSGRQSVLMLIRSAVALATMKPVLLLRLFKKAEWQQVNVAVFGGGA